MNKYICVHAHFYQPPRENPWLEEIEVQDSAYPFHDWNERIAAECYAPNTASRIFNGDRRIIDIVNNYSKISFNFGPTLLIWMKEHRPDTYEAILEADRQGRERFSGHGPALAQIYNHMIIPLANSRDKRTQVIWGIEDFCYRFQREPEGMWLSETAVDLETLDILAERGIRFTILAPRQAAKIRKIGDRSWHDVSEARIDPKEPYLCRLPSGRSITLFFYDGPISQSIGFGNLLDSGENLANALLGAFVDHPGDQLVHIATDGETYGHHKSFGDMALAYCLHHIESHDLAKITIYGEYLEKHPPQQEVQIFENSSWSCIHGVERWQNDCGCNTGMHGGWNQKWRAPLRGAFDWVRDNLGPVYEKQTAGLMRNPWQARDDYIQVILDRSEDNINKFLEKHTSKGLSQENKVKILKLLEMQRHTMLMYTSCAWFFDEVSGIETVQVIDYAARAMQLANEVSGIALEDAFIGLMERIPSNIPQYNNGGAIYKMFVKPVVLDLLRVGVHYAISSIFRDYEEDSEIYTYRTHSHINERLELGRQSLAIGLVEIKSKITWHQARIGYAVLHLGDHNVICGARYYRGEEAFAEMQSSMREAFGRSDIPEVIRLINAYFEDHSYSLWHLFRDEQRRILYVIFNETLQGIEASFRQIETNLVPIMQAIIGMNVEPPKYFRVVLEFLLNTDLRRQLEADELDFDQVQKMCEDVKRWGLEIDKVTLGFVATEKINGYADEWAKDPIDVTFLERSIKFIEAVKSLELNIDFWRMQTIYFRVGKTLAGEMEQKKSDGEPQAAQWLEMFRQLGELQNIKLE